MTHSKLSFFLIIFLLITTVTFVVELTAQDTEENSDPIQEFLKKAEELVEQNKIDEAVELYERIVIAAPDDFDSRAELATLYARIKQHEKAAQTWEKLLETDPENIKYQDELVDSLQSAGKHNEAFEIAQAYIQSYPEVGVHYARLAKLYAAEGDAVAVIENYKKAAAYGYDHKDIYLRLAEHYFMMDDIAATEKALNNAITVTSGWTRERIERQLVNLYRYQGNFEELLQKAETDGTLTPEMQKQRAQYFRNTGDLENAAVHYKKAVEMTNDTYDRNDILRELLDLYAIQGREDLALAFYEAEAAKEIIAKGLSTSYSSSGITMRFGSDGTRSTLINVFKNQGKLHVLASHFESKLEKDVENHAVLEMLSEIYWESENYQKAAEAYQTLGETEPTGRRNLRSYFYAVAAFHKM